MCVCVFVKGQWSPLRNAGKLEDVGQSLSSLCRKKKMLDGIPECQLISLLPARTTRGVGAFYYLSGLFEDVDLRSEAEP